jgi:hypothetical protein
MSFNEFLERRIHPAHIVRSKYLTNGQSSLLECFHDKTDDGRDSVMGERGLPRVLLTWDGSAYPQSRDGGHGPP